MSNPNTAVAIPEDNSNRGNQTLRDFVEGSGMGQWMSFNPQTREGGELLIRATLLEADDLATFANMDVNVANFYANEVESIKDNGEIERYVRIVIFDENGKPYSCGSSGIRKSLVTLMKIRGNMPWNPPVKCKVRIRKLDGAKQYMTLEPDIDSLYPSAPLKRADQKAK